MGFLTQGPPQVITLELARGARATTFVETGTFRGGTTRWAAQHFQRVYTIERAETIYNAHHEELARLPGVTPLLGDSRSVLPRVLAEIGNAPALFWLDGHWSGGETAGDGDECPLLHELAALSVRSDDIILIDDARLFLCAPPRPHRASDWPTIPEIVDALARWKRRPFMQIVDDVIFVVPDGGVARDALVSYAQDRSAAFWRSVEHIGAPTARLRSFMRKLRP